MTILWMGLYLDDIIRMNDISLSLYGSKPRTNHTGSLIGVCTWIIMDDYKWNRSGWEMMSGWHQPDEWDHSHCPRTIIATPYIMKETKISGGFTHHSCVDSNVRHKEKRNITFDNLTSNKIAVFISTVIFYFDRN